MGKKGSSDGPAEEMGKDRGVNGKRGRVKEEKASDGARKQKEPALRLLVPHGPLLDPAPGRRAREAPRFCAAPCSVRGGGGRGGLSGHAAPPPWRACRRLGLRDPPHPRLGSQRAPRALRVAVAFNLHVPRLGEGALGLRCRVPSLLRSLPPTSQRPRGDSSPGTGYGPPPPHSRQVSATGEATEAQRFSAARG